MKYVLIYEENEKGDSLSGYFPDIPGVYTQGDNLKHLKKMGQEALELYFECALDDILKSKKVFEIPEAKTPVDTPNSIQVCVPSSRLLPIILRNYRLKEKRTQKEIADKAGLKVSNYCRIESGRASNITIDVLDRLKESMGDHSNLINV